MSDDESSSVDLLGTTAASILKRRPITPNIEEKNNGKHLSESDLGVEVEQINTAVDASSSESSRIDVYKKNSDRKPNHQRQAWNTPIASRELPQEAMQSPNNTENESPKLSQQYKYTATHSEELTTIDFDQTQSPSIYGSPIEKWIKQIDEAQTMNDIHRIEYNELQSLQVSLNQCASRINNFQPRNYEHNLKVVSTTICFVQAQIMEIELSQRHAVKNNLFTQINPSTMGKSQAALEHHSNLEAIRQEYKRKLKSRLQDAGFSELAKKYDKHRSQ